MKISLNSLFLTILASGLYFAFPINSLSSKTNFPVNNTCQGAIERVKSSFERARYRIVLTTQFEQVSMERNDHPQNRPLGYAFAYKYVQGGGRKPFRNFDKFEVFLKGHASQIISNCEAVSSVSFGEYQSDGITEYGLMKSGKIELFKCIYFDVSRKRENPPQISWGRLGCAE